MVRFDEIEPLLQSGVRSFIYDTFTSARDKPGRAERHLRDTYMQMEARLGGLLETANRAGGTEVDSLEHDEVRPLVLQIRRFALRQHLTLIKPYFGWEDIPESANQVSIAGTPEFCEMFTPLLQKRGLQVAATPRGWEQGRAYWAQLRESGLCVFGFPERAPALRASVSCRLGWALACGKPVLVVREAGKKLPFDVDVEPAVWDPKNPQTSGRLSEALDEAIYCVPRDRGGSSVRATVRFAQSELSLQQDQLGTVQQWLDSGGRLDPVEIHNFLNTLSDLRGGVFALVFPPWPGSYPDAEDPRCFHIMPYLKSFDSAREAVRAACASVGVHYVRDDETEKKGLITHSIWEEIGKASTVVVDVTGLNPNVALELGLADALGRPALLVARDEVKELFPEIGKRPVKVYTSPAHLQKIVETELSGG